MLSGFQKIVEQRIRDAQRRGEFDNLPGAGKPLRFEDENVPEDLRLAYKILKNADCLPPDVELRKEIRRTEDLLRGMEDVEEKYRTLKKLNYLIMRLNMSRKGPVELEMPQVYERNIEEHLGKDKNHARK